MRHIEYNADFTQFWMTTNMKGSKTDAQTAFRERLRDNSMEEIALAYEQVKKEKRGRRLEYHPAISTFLNSHFEGYLHRAQNPEEEEVAVDETPAELTNRLLRGAISKELLGAQDDN